MGNGGSSAPGWPSEGRDSGPLLGRYLATLNRFKWLAVIIVAIGTGIGYTASRAVKPNYQVQARLWLDHSSGGSRGPIQEGQLMGASSWVDLLTSYAVLDYVVLEQRLYLESEPGAEALLANFQLKDRFLPGEYRVKPSPDRRKIVLETASGALVETVNAGDSVGRSVGFSWVPNLKLLQNPRGVRFEVRRPRDRARQLGSEFKAKMTKNGAFLHIDMKGPDPKRAAATLNAVVDRFVNLGAELKRGRLQEFATILSDQLQHAQQNLQSAEIALENFRIQTVTTPSDNPTMLATGAKASSSPALNSFIQLKGEQDQVQLDRMALQRALARASTSSLSTAELETIGAVQSSSELKTALAEVATKRATLRALQYRYTDEYSEVKRLKSELQVLESETIPAFIRGLVDELNRRDSEYGRLVGDATSEMRQIPPRVMEEARLSRQVSIAGDLYTMLRQRHEEARLAALGTSPDIRIVDRAVPTQRPLKDRSQLMILYGFLGGLGVVVLAVFSLDKFDRRVRYPEEVTHGLRLPILAAIPRLKSNGNGRASGESASHVIEAFRGLRLTVLQERGNEGCFVTGITSPGSGDGKSFIAINLAFALADQGYRTLLIDGDIRRGGLHHFLGRSRKPGLTDFLAGAATREQIVQRTSYPLLDLVACGRRLQGGPELLGSPGLGQFIRDLRSQYAVILIDTPPLGAGVDPYVLGMAAGNLLLVLRTGLSDMEFTEAKLSVLDRLPVRLIGAILNGVPPGGAYRYYGYIPGYESADEEQQPREASALPALS